MKGVPWRKHMNSGLESDEHETLFANMIRGSNCSYSVFSEAPCAGYIWANGAMFYPNKDKRIKSVWAGFRKPNFWLDYDRNNIYLFTAFISYLSIYKSSRQLKIVQHCTIVIQNWLSKFSSIKKDVGQYLWVSDNSCCSTHAPSSVLLGKQQ